MKTFEVNGKKYNAKAFDFNLICDLEDMGIAMEDVAKKPMSTVRAYFALCTNKDREFAGKEMEQHLINGGNFEDVMLAMTEEMEKSDFFRAINKTEEQKTAKSQSKEK